MTFISNFGQVFSCKNVDRVPISQETITCLKAAVETLEKGFTYVQVNKKDTRTTLLPL